MEEAKFDLSALSLTSAQSLDEKLLLDFYRVMYGPRGLSLARVWNWLSRPGFRDPTGPIVLLQENRIVAHLGFVPFRASLDGQPYFVTRGMDLAVLPELRGHGLASLLLKKWMEIPDVQIGWPNEQAIGAYRKLKWSESTDSYLHFYLLRPFDHPKFIGSMPPAPRAVLNALTKQLLSLIYRPHASSIGRLSSLEPNPDSLARFLSPSSVERGLLQPVREMDYLKWRLTESPERPRYKIFEVGDLAMAVKLCEKRGHKYIDLLCVSSGCNERETRLLISTLATWGMREGYSYVRYFTKSRRLTDYLRRSLRGIVKRTYFIFHSPDNVLTEKLKHSAWHLELIDGDFEEF